MLLQMTIGGSLLALLVILIRRAGRNRLPGTLLVVMWDAVLARFLIPGDIPLIHSSHGPHGEVAAGFAAGADYSWLYFVWAIVAAAVCIVLGYVAVSEYRLLRDAMPLDPGQEARCHALLPEGMIYPAFVSSRISTPVAAGIIRRRIVLPQGYTSWSERALQCALTHEAIHLRRMDPLHKLIAAAAAAVQWFNPLAWLTLRMLGADLEKACDEGAVRTLGEERRAEYARSVVELASRRRQLLICASGFGRSGIKERISELMTKKRMTIFAVVAAVVIFAAAVTAFAGEAEIPEAARDETPEESAATEAVKSTSVSVTYDDETGETYVEHDGVVTRLDDSEILADAANLAEPGTVIHTDDGIVITVAENAGDEVSFVVTETGDDLTNQDE